MVKRKIDGCETTIKRGQGCFIIRTKLQLTDKEIEVGEKENGVLPKKQTKNYIHMYAQRVNESYQK